MIINLTVIFLIILFGILFLVKSNKTPSDRKNYIKLTSILLILQSGLRNTSVGADTYAYYLYFNKIKLQSWEPLFQNLIIHYQLGIGKDPGYPILEKFIQYFTGNYQVFLFLIAMFFFTALGRFIYYNTTKISHTILAFVIYSVLFYNFFSITGHRQTIATAVALYSFELIKKKKLFPFIIFLLLASTIHKSVLVFIPFYFIVKLKWTKTISFIALISFPILMYFKNNASLFLKELGGYDNYNIYENAGTLTFTIMYLIIFIATLSRIKQILKIQPNARYYFNALSVGLVLLPLTWVNSATMRIVQYFSIFILLLIPIAIDSLKQYSYKLKINIMFVSVLILISLYIKSNYNHQYKFFWQHMKLSNNYYNVIKENE